MWSEGEWTGPDYRVAYAMSASPTGPFRRAGTILEQDGKIARGAGHHSVVNVPGTDEWYITYHRRPLNDNNGNHRELAIDRLFFNEDGTIRPVVMTTEGVAPRALVLGNN
jgi:beta-xylosidase